jgi:uncharacterized membrane protein (DUF4010 family)
MDFGVAQQLAISVGLGLLVGFQREWTAPHVAGLRTFALITVFGTFAGLFIDALGVWIVAAGLVAVAAIVIVGGLTKFADTDERGITTQVAALVMYVVGVAVAVDRTVLAVIVAGGLAVLLHWKRPLHTLVDRFGDEDVRGIIQLVLIALVILPILPDRSFGPYAVLNPFEIWLMVVLICSISLGGYIAYKFLGAKTGMLLAGILGGLISSTATTISYSRASRKSPETAALACFVIIMASTIVFGRVLIEIAIVAPHVLQTLAPPLAIMMGLVAVIAFAAYWFSPHDRQSLPTRDDPSDLKAAIVFGLLYAAVLFAVAAAKEHFGERGLYVVAALSGLTDMDAITLSTAQMINADRLDVDTGWRMILIGAMSNLAFKAAVVCLLGTRPLIRRMALMFGAALAGSGLLLWFWPNAT